MKTWWKAAVAACCLFPMTVSAAGAVTASGAVRGTSVSRITAVSQTAAVKSTPAGRNLAAVNPVRQGTLLFVPLDDRPVCKDYTADTLRSAGWDLKMPPEAAISSYDRGGSPEKLFSWLEANGPQSLGMVVSADALIYGGLVDSRTHHTDPQILLARAQRLLNLKKKCSGHPNVYAFVTVMRSPRASSAPVEPAYYGTWGPKIFQRGALMDKTQENMASSKEKRQLEALNQEIPPEVLQDLDKRREVNLEVTKTLLQGVREGRLDYLLVGRDDTAPFSQAHMDALQIQKLVQDLPGRSVRFFAGADQLGLVLLDRAVNVLTYKTPLVYAFYGQGVGAKTVTGYEDEPIGKSVREHIFAAGGYPVPQVKRADTCLGVFTLRDGSAPESNSPRNDGIITGQERSFASAVRKYLQQQKPVIVADVAFGNGSSTALVKELYTAGLAERLAAYGGWNTGSNAMGFALGQGLLASTMSEADRIRLLTVRYLEDWGYQSVVRKYVYENLIWPQHLKNTQMDGAALSKAEKAVREGMTRLTEPVMDGAALNFDYYLPWHRMFEVYVQSPEK